MPVLGTNWSLRTLRPSFWQVADAPVWNREAGRLAGLSPSVVVLAQSGIFRAGPYSSRSPNVATRVLGKSHGYRLHTFQIKPLKGGRRRPDGHFVRDLEPPFMPTSVKDLFHPGGNSACYAIQWGFLMEADPIFLMAFTLQKNGGYEFGPVNPVTNKPSGALWKEEVPVRPLAWLEWVEKNWPGRVRLLPGWKGPIYDVFRTETLSAAGPSPQKEPPLVAGSRPAWL